METDARMQSTDSAESLRQELKTARNQLGHLDELRQELEFSKAKVNTLLSDLSERESAIEELQRQLQQQQDNVQT